MQACVRRGCGIGEAHHPELPGGYKVRRRAPQVHQRLTATSSQADPLQQMDWVSTTQQADVASSSTLVLDQQSQLPI